MSDRKVVNPAEAHRQSVEQYPHYVTSDGQYQLRDDGVYFVYANKMVGAEGQDEHEIKICGYLKVECRFHDVTYNTWGKEIRFRDHDGHEHHWNISDKTLTAEPTVVRKELADQGLWMMPRTERAKDRVIEYLSVADPKNRALCTDRLGWLDIADGSTVFVLPTETIGDSEGIKVQYVSPSSEKPEIAAKGTVDEWKERVAIPARHSSRAVLCICAAFAAPLLKLANRENIGFHLRGHSSSGKSMALMIGSSVLGSPKLKKVWRATSNGLEGQALQHNDAVLQLDEIGQANGRDIGKCIYDLMNGSQKARANIYGLARKVNKWRLITLSSGEIGLREMALENNVRVHTGQEIRLIEIPADANHKLGVNESLPEGIDSIQEYAKQLKQACSECYGTAFRTWVASLIDQPPSPEAMQTELLSIAGRLAPQECSSQVKRVAESFALLAYAGKKATTLNITGWSEDTAFSCIQRCFRAWLAEFGNSESRESDEIVAHVENLLITQRARFAPLRRSDFSPTSPNTPQNLLGWVEVDTFLIPSTVYQNEFCRGRPAREVNKILFERGVLIPKQAHPFRASVQIRIPDMGNDVVRCLRLQLPKKGNTRNSKES